MIDDQDFYDICFTFFILRLRLRPTAEGQSLSGPNSLLRPKVKTAPTVQHWRLVSIVTILFIFSIQTNFSCKMWVVSCGMRPIIKKEKSK